MLQRLKSLEWNDKRYYRRLVFLALPIVGQELLNSLINVIDSFMMGSQGLSAMNGVGFGNQIYILFNIILFGINSGSSIFTGQYWGKNDLKGIHKTMGIGFITAILIGTAFFAAILLVPERLIGFYSNEAPVIAAGVSYLRTVSPIYLLMPLITITNSALRSTGQTRLPMFTTVVTLLTKAGVSYLLIFVLHYGVIGAAIATLSARIIEAAIQIILVRVLKMPIVSNIRGYFAITSADFKRFFAITSPVIINEFLWAFGTTLYMVAYKGLGNESQGAAQISSAVSNLFMVVGFGVGYACAIMLSNAIGAGELSKAKIYARKSLIIVIPVSLILSGALILFIPLILSVYDVGETVKSLASSNLLVVAGLLTVKLYNFTVIIGIVRSGGDTKYCMFLDLAGLWLIGVPMAFLGSYVFGVPIYYVLLLVGIEEVFKFILGTRRVLSDKWVRNVVD